MLKQLKYLSRYLSLLIFAFSLVACGGGGSAPSPTPAPAPAPAPAPGPGPATAANPTLTFNAIKTFHFTWTDVSDATHYKLMENPDGVSGFTQVGSDITQGTQNVDHVVPLYARLNGQYILQTCFGDICNDSAIIAISDTLVDAIGYLKASNTGSFDFFGGAASLSADGNTLAVSAQSDDSNTTGVGSTPNDNGNANGSGAVYVFTRMRTSWAEQAYIKASNTGEGDFFGGALSLSANGNTLAVGAQLEDSNTTGVGSTPNDDGSANESGAVYVFVRTETIWAEQAYIKASNTGAVDFFGGSVGLSADGNTLAVGAYLDDSNTSGVDSTPNDDGSANDSGAVYVFALTGTIWAEQAYIKASNTGAGDDFGKVVSLSWDGNTLVVGAMDEDSNNTGVGSTPNDDGTANNSGAVYIFTRTGSNWTEQAYVKASNNGGGDIFGFAVNLSADGNTLAVGAFQEDSNTTGVGSTPNDNSISYNSGAVYVFVRTETTWVEQAYIKASNTGEVDRFGYAVSLSADGNILAVSAYHEDNTTTGVESTSNDEGFAADAGAVYVFTRTDTTWVEQAYVKASNTDAEDQFGIAVSLSSDGNTLAVGALNEDSNTTGVDSTPNDDGSANNSGAVYLY